jgi:hypothetical protein
MALPRGWDIGLQTGAEFVRDAADQDYDSQFVNSIALGHAIVGNLSGYVEFFSVVPSTGDSDWEGILGTGVTYALSDDLQLDGGMNFGLTRAAPDYNPFFGVTWRF